MMQFIECRPENINKLLAFTAEYEYQGFKVTPEIDHLRILFFAVRSGKAGYFTPKKSKAWELLMEQTGTPVTLIVKTPDYCMWFSNKSVIAGRKKAPVSIEHALQQVIMDRANGNTLDKFLRGEK